MENSDTEESNFDEKDLCNDDELYMSDNVPKSDIMHNIKSKHGLKVNIVDVGFIKVAVVPKALKITFSIFVPYA